MEASSGQKRFFFFTKYFVRTGNPSYLGEKPNISFSQNLPNMEGESCTVLRLRLMHKLAMSHIIPRVESPRVKSLRKITSKLDYIGNG